MKSSANVCDSVSQGGADEIRMERMVKAPVLFLLHPKKSLGQNFLRDENIARKIVAAIEPAPGDVIVEVGPGAGALTRVLAPRVERLIAVEIDARAVKLLRELFSGTTVEVRHENFLDTDLECLAENLLKTAGGRMRIVGNIPYNITSPILFHALDHRARVKDITIMMQKEVARRLVASPRTKEYGILSVFTQLFADVRLLFDVSPNAFFPKPKVTSSVVRLGVLETPRFPLRDEQFFRAMVRAIFGKRRKTLRNTLRYFLGEAPFELPGTIDLGRRPEEFSVEELVELGNILSLQR